MKKLTTILLAATAVVSSVSCKKDMAGDGGPITSQTRAIQNFTGIELKMNGNVYYTKSDIVKLEVTAPESIHGMLETGVINGKLLIRYSNGKNYDNDPSIRINVSAPDVNTFLLNTSGSIYVMNDISPANLLLRSHGSGDIVLQKVVTGNIDAESSQSGRISAGSGSAISEKLKTDASGKIDFSGIAAKTVTTQTVGSGDIRVKVSDNLDVRIEGSGCVYFSGNPYISTHISGSGHLVRL
jgi:hypothetical protein